MDTNEQLAQEIMKHTGGANNITGLNHCTTRLRLTVNDPSKFDVDAIKRIPGVLDVVEALGGYQVVVGNNVSKVYKAIVAKYDIKTEEANGRIAANPFEALLNVLADVVGPVIPAVVVAGLTSAIITIATMLGMPNEGPTYELLYAVSQAPFYFLPMIVAYTSARHWGINPVLTMMLAGVLLYPNVIELMTSGNAIDLFGLPVTAATYTSSLIPIILTCWVMHYVYDFVEQKCPEAIRYVFAPLISIAVMLPVMLCVTGPAGTWLGDLISKLISVLDSTAPGLTVLVLSLLAPLMVLTGSHLALMPVLLQNFATLGYDNSLLIAFIGMNFSQFAVSLAVFLKAKNPALKSTAFSTGITAFLSGTTEPALYGLCLRLKRPLIASFIGCAANGIFCALTGVKIYSFGAPSFFTMANFIDPAGSNNFLFAIAAAAISIAVTFIATWVLGFDESDFGDTPNNTEEAKQQDEAASSDTTDTIICSPISGTISELKSEDKHGIYRQIEIAGRGNIVNSPVKGIVKKIEVASRAVTIETSDKTAITVSCKSKDLDADNSTSACPTLLVSEGSEVQSETPLFKFSDGIQDEIVTIQLKVSDGDKESICIPSGPVKIGDRIVALV